jgi:hypothetical protein
MDALVRFWSKVVKTEACWVRTGTALPKGYTKIWWNGSMKLAHRVSWMIHFGPIPESMMVLHTCDNPPCVRPDHLFLGTNQTNMTDMISKGRHHYSVRTHCKNGHEFAVHGQLRRYHGKRGSGWRRVCMACNQIYEQRRHRQPRPVT